jgi:uncharacterized membrane protein (GlpM family)
MNIKSLLIYFLTGGVVTVLIVVLEQRGSRLWSGLATLVPVFTVVGYLFIGSARGGDVGGGIAVSQHAKLVLVGTLVSWVPYMMTVIIASPRWGANRAVALGMAVFFVFAIGYLQAVARYRWFQ